MVFVSEWMLLRSDFDRDSELGKVAGTIASYSLYVMELERVFLEGFIVRNEYSLGLLCDL